MPTPMFVYLAKKRITLHKVMRSPVLSRAPRWLLMLGQKLGLLLERHQPKADADKNDEPE